MRKNIGFVFLIAGVAAGLWLWIDAAHSRREAEAQRVALAGRGRELTAEIVRLERTLAAAERTQKAREASAVPPRIPAKAPATAPAATAARGPSTPPRTTTEMIAADPQLQLLDLQQRRARIALDYGEFFEANRFSPAQIERFVAAKMKRAETGMDLEAVIPAQDVAGQQTVAVLQRRADAEQDEALAQALGPDVFLALQEYERTMPVRAGVVNHLAGMAALAGLPLTAEQGNRLFQAALAATGGDVKSKGADLVQKIDLGMLDEQARQILTPAQFQLFLRGSLVRKTLELGVVMAKAREVEARRGPPPAVGPKK